MTKWNTFFKRQESCFNARFPFRLKAKGREVQPESHTNGIDSDQTKHIKADQREICNGIFNAEQVERKGEPGFDSWWTLTHCYEMETRFHRVRTGRRGTTWPNACVRRDTADHVRRLLHELRARFEGFFPDRSHMCQWNQQSRSAKKKKTLQQTACEPNLSPDHQVRSHKIDFCSFLDESSAQETGNVRWLGDGAMLCVLFARCRAKRSRNPAAAGICFGPGLTPAGPRQISWLITSNFCHRKRCSWARGRHETRPQ